MCASAGQMKSVIEAGLVCQAGRVEERTGQDQTC